MVYLLAIIGWFSINIEIYRTFQENCEHCLEEEEKLLKESVEANEGIMNFVKNMKNELDKIEENFKSIGQYQPYEEEPVRYFGGDHFFPIIRFDLDK